MMLNTNALSGGFHDPATQSARAFRAVLEALARPGRIETLSGATPPAPLSPAGGAVLLTLVDGTTPLHLAGGYDVAEVRDWVRFHLNAPLVGPAQAQFVLGRWDDLLPLSRYAQGLPDYPDRSATLIVEVDTLANQGARLSGPGIESVAFLNLPAIDPFVQNHAQFPLGLDFFLTAGARVAGLARSTRVEDC